MDTKCVEWEYGQRYNEQGEWNPRLVACDFCGEYYEPEQEWKDCDLKGHEEGCFMLVCPDCGTKDRDCEDQLWVTKP
jgi:hypothetical protein